LARISRIARLAAGTGVFALAFVFNSEIRAIRAKIISVPKSSHQKFFRENPNPTPSFTPAFPSASARRLTCRAGGGRMQR
jgi:hypothetical protein